MNFNAYGLVGATALLTMASGGAYEICAPEHPSAMEQLAVEELSHYLAICADEVSVDGQPVKIHVGDTPAAQAGGLGGESFADEEWYIGARGGDIIIQGGGARGVLWGVYHFLEDKIGVSWLTPVAEYVPERRHFALAPFAERGRPALACRYSYLPNYDGAAQRRFMQRNRGTGDEIFGSPATCHTFDSYIPAGELLESHPEYFSLHNGKRMGGNSFPNGGQLCLSHPEVIGIFRRKLKEFILADEAKAARDGMPAPRIYDISQNDNANYCECPACAAKVASGYNQTDIMIEFINIMARDLAEFRPEYALQFFAYVYTESLPNQVKPEANVIVRLCDTNSNEALPITHADNTFFREKVEKWSQISSQLFIWEYILKATAPQAPEYNLPDEMAYYDANKVTGYFWQSDEPCADMVDLHRYLEFKYFEDPTRQDFEALRRRFMREYFGAAAPAIEEYRQLIRTAAEANQAKAWSFGHEFGLRHIDLDTLIAAQAAFDKALAAVGDDAELQERIQWTRIPLDTITGYTLTRYYQNLWERSGRDGVFPLDPAPARERIRTALAAMSAKGQPGIEKRMRKELDRYELLPERIVQPAPFVGRDYMDITPEHFGWNAIADVVVDPLAATGYAYRAKLPDNHSDWTFPLCFAVTDLIEEKELMRAEVAASELPVQSEYRWYVLTREYRPGNRAALHWVDGPGFFVGLSDLVNFAGTPATPLELWISFRLDAATRSAYMERVVAVKP